MVKKFFQNFTQIATITNNEKFLVGRSSDGKTMYALISQLGIDQVRAIAEGRFNALVFLDTAQLQAWFNGGFNRPDNIVPSDLVIGQNIYIESLDEDDYWVSSMPATSMANLSGLPDDKIDLSNYVEKNGTDRLMTVAEGEKLSGIEDGAQVNLTPVVSINDNRDNLPLAASQGNVLANKMTYKCLTIPVNISISGYFTIPTNKKLEDFSLDSSQVPVSNINLDCIYESSTNYLANGKMVFYSASIEDGYIFIGGYAMTPLTGRFYISIRQNQ